MLAAFCLGAGVGVAAVAARVGLGEGRELLAHLGQQQLLLLLHVVDLALVLVEEGSFSQSVKDRLRVTGDEAMCSTGGTAGSGGRVTDAVCTGVVVIS